jgi:hypothetical protein
MSVESLLPFLLTWWQPCLRPRSLGLWSKALLEIVDPRPIIVEVEVVLPGVE